MAGRERLRARKIAAFLTTVFHPQRLYRLWQICGSFEEIWKADSESFRRAGVDRQAYEKFLRRANEFKESELERKLEKADCSVITLDDEEYPPLLREIALPPPVLFLKGKHLNSYPLCVSVVGTRKPTAYGRSISRQISRELSLAGVSVVSGLARGIDTEAHLGALEGEGATIAVLGSGVDVVYPFQNRKIYERICEEGTVVSEFFPQTPPRAYHFPQRNRIISGLSRGIVVIEAGRKSGALITAYFALEQGREVFAFPGSIHSPVSRGSHKLIKEGAKLVERVEDILEELGIVISKKSELKKTSPLEEKVLSALEFEPKSVDELVNLCKKPVSEILSCLTLLQLQGKVAQDFGEKFYRVG